MSDVWPFHRHHRTDEPSPVQRAAQQLVLLAGDLQTASDHLLEQHGRDRNAPPPTGAPR